MDDVKNIAKVLTNNIVTDIMTNNSLAPSDLRRIIFQAIHTNASAIYVAYDRECHVNDLFQGLKTEIYNRLPESIDEFTEEMYKDLQACISPVLVDEIVNLYEDYLSNDGTWCTLLKEAIKDSFLDIDSLMAKMHTLPVKCEHEWTTKHEGTQVCDKCLATRDTPEGECPHGGDITDDCDGCINSVTYHYVDGECVERDKEES